MLAPASRIFLVESRWMKIFAAFILNLQARSLAIISGFPIIKRFPLYKIFGPGDHVLLQLGPGNQSRFQRDGNV